MPVGDLIWMESTVRLELMVIVFAEPAESEMKLEAVLLDAGTVIVLFAWVDEDWTVMLVALVDELENVITRVWLALVVLA